LANERWSLNQRKMKCIVVAIVVQKIVMKVHSKKVKRYWLLEGGCVQLKIGSSFGSITEEDEIVWRNPLFEPPPHAFLTKKKE
jgi:hypothetical protein